MRSNMHTSHCARCHGTLKGASLTCLAKHKRYFHLQGCVEEGSTCPRHDCEQRLGRVGAGERLLNLTPQQVRDLPPYGEMVRLIALGMLMSIALMGGFVWHSGLYPFAGAIALAAGGHVPFLVMFVLPGLKKLRETLEEAG